MNLNEDESANLVEHLERGQIPNWFINRLPKGPPPEPWPGWTDEEEHRAAVFLQRQFGVKSIGYCRMAVQMMLSEVKDGNP